MKRAFLILATGCLPLLVGCSVKPVAIDYGKDACHFCKMNIVDKTHAAERVTAKGKAFKYDALECLVNDLENHNDPNPALLLVANYQEVGSLIDAKSATYIISKNIRSPMGANLSALASHSAAERLQKEKQGTIHSWDELVLNFDKLTNKHSLAP